VRATDLLGPSSDLDCRSDSRSRIRGVVSRPGDHCYLPELEHPSPAAAPRRAAAHDSCYDELTGTPKPTSVPAVAKARAIASLRDDR